MEIIIENDVEYTIDGDGVLIMMEGALGANHEIPIAKVPSMLQSGHKITTLDKRFCIGKFGEIVVSPEIKDIREEAFRGANVKTVHWPKAYTEIPKECFRGSSVEQIFGIENVTEIGDSAFADTRMAEFCWPQGCKEIPYQCFAFSNIDRLRGTENVRTIGERAFYNTHITKSPCFDNVEEVGEGAFCCSSMGYFKWPTKCQKIPEHCFAQSDLVSISNLEGVQTIGQYAFYRAMSLKELDLSGSAVLSIGKGALAKVDVKFNKFPYYIDDLAFFDPWR